MLAFNLSLLFCGLYSTHASPIGYKVEDFAKDDVEEDEDWVHEAMMSAKRQNEHEERMQWKDAELQKSEKSRLSKKAALAKSQGLQMRDISEFAEVAEEDSSVAQMHSKLTALDKLRTLQQHWKELARELQAARIEEFLDGIPEMPKSLTSLEAEVSRLENIKKVEGLGKTITEPTSPQKSNLLQIGAASSSSQFEGAARAMRLIKVQTELGNLKGKEASAAASLAESEVAYEKAAQKVESAKEGLEDSEGLMGEVAKELRGRDREWALKERAHLEEEYKTLVSLKDVAAKKVQADKISTEELYGQKVLTSFSAAMQEAQLKQGSSFSQLLTKYLSEADESSDEDLEDALHWVKKEKNPAHLSGWGLFKKGPAAISAEPIAAALKELDAHADAEELAQKLLAKSA